jgi:flagellar FliL protein
MEIVIVAIVVLAVVLVALFLIQRRRRANSEVLPPPELGDPVDYTSLPYEEPTTWSDRFRNASPATKLLIVLLPLVAIISLGVIFATLQSGGESASAEPTPEPVSLTVTDATLASPTKILVRGTTNLRDGSQVTASLLEDGQPIDWAIADTTKGSVNNGRVQISMERRENAPATSNTKAYSVVLNAADAGGGNVASTPVAFTPSGPYAASFFSASAATGPTTAPTTAPTNTVQPTTAPTQAPAEPTAALTPEPDATGVLTATVRNGGNVRTQPNLSGEVLDQNNAFETVELLEKTADGLWYRMTNPRDITGWFSASLLTIDQEVASKVPVQGAAVPTAVVGSAPPTPAATTATPQATFEPSGLVGLVRNGGNVRAQPNLSGRFLDQNNAGEPVQLLEKTADGRWYRMTNIRSVTGWFSASLLTIDSDIAAQVPVAR